MKEQILETCHINHRINLILIDAISREGLNCTLSTRGGRTVALQFAHLHKVRFKWMEVAANEFLKGQTIIDKTKPADKKQFKKRLSESADAIAKWIEHSLSNEGKVKGFKRGVLQCSAIL